MDIGNKALGDIHAHAEEVFPQECCGVGILDCGTVSIVRACNVSDDPLRSFKIDPEFYLRHIKDVLFVYHSHPNGTARASVPDLAACDAVGKPFLILAWPSKELRHYAPAGTAMPLEGRPFVYGIYDCVAIVEDYYEQERGIELPAWERPKYGWWEGAGAVDYISKLHAEAGFVPADGIMDGDAVVMQTVGATVPNHVGIYKADNKLLHHTLEGISCVCEYSRYWRENTVKVLRHVDTCTPAR